jgi:uncharacterized PurR-regulated membrane protein YhhQ (DUF165 family)
VAADDLRGWAIAKTIDTPGSTLSSSAIDTLLFTLLALPVRSSRAAAAAIAIVVVITIIVID